MARETPYGRTVTLTADIRKVQSWNLTGPERFTLPAGTVLKIERANDQRSTTCEVVKEGEPLYPGAYRFLVPNSALLRAAGVRIPKPPKPRYVRHFLDQAERIIGAGTDTRSSRNHRSYRNRNDPRWYMDCKELYGAGADLDTLASELAAEWDVDAATIRKELENVYEWHREQWWEQADESARFIFNGDESGQYTLNSRDWDAHAIIVQGGRSGGWVSASVPELDGDRERALTTRQARKVRKWARSLGENADYLASAEALRDSWEANFTDTRGRDRHEHIAEREHFAGAPAGAD